MAAERVPCLARKAVGLASRDFRHLRAGWCRPVRNRPELGGLMTDTEQRAYFAVGDEVHFLTGWASRGRVRLEASPSLTLTPAECRRLASYLLYAAARAEERLGKRMPT
jgi:hypothetical protein